MAETVELDAILSEDYEAPRGLMHIDAVGLLAQLDKEVVKDYDAVGVAVDDIVTALMAMQENPNPLSVGTVDYDTELSFSVDMDSILGALKRLQESVGGYIYVDSDKQLQWRSSIGSDTGQQLRFGKNIMQIRRSVDYSELANRLWVWGAGEGEAEVRLGKGIVTSQPQANADLISVWYNTTESEWEFDLGGSSYNDRWMAGWPFTALKAQGGACRFPNVVVPQGATILSAEIRFTAHADPGSGNDVNSRIYMEDADDADQFSTWNDYNTRPGTTEIDWDGIDSWTGLQVYAKSVLSAVQTVVNRVGWSSGNAMVVFWEDHDNRSTQYHSRRTYRNPAMGRSPLLYIEYTLPDAVDYVEDAASQDMFGFAADQVKDQAITDSATLFEFAVRTLGERAYPIVSYGGALADLERYGFPFDALALGNTVRVMDEGISLDTSTRIVRLVRSLVNRMDVQVELSNRPKTILDKMSFAKDARWRQHFY